MQPFGTEVVRSCKGVFLQRLWQKLHFAAKGYVCVCCTLCLFTLDSSQNMVIIENIFQMQPAVLLSESKISCLCTQHVFKKE